MKKKVSHFVAIFIILIIITLFYVIQKMEIGMLKIQNYSGETLKNTTITYKNIEESNNIEIGTLKNKETFKHEIDDKKEMSIELSFIDNEGNSHSEVVIGYVYKGIDSTRIRILKKNGKFIFEEKKH